MSLLLPPLAPAPGTHPWHLLVAGLRNAQTLLSIDKCLKKNYNLLLIISLLSLATFANRQQQLPLLIDSSYHPSIVNKFLVKSIKQVLMVLDEAQSSVPPQAASGSWRFSWSQGWLVMLLPVVLMLTSCGGDTLDDASAADLSISTTSTGPTVLVAGNDLSFEATVTNQGSIDANSITLSYYRSADNRLYGGDVKVGTDIQQPRLAASAVFYESSDITTPVDLSDGIYYYYACVNRVATETNLTNNCSDAVTISIGGRPTPDLNLRSSPSATPSSLLTGASFDFSINVSNTGTGEADSTPLRVYQVAGGVPDPDNDDEVGTNTLHGLAAGVTFASSSTIVAPDTVGVYYYYACIDAVTGDPHNDNDCSNTVEVTVTAPDLVVQSFEVTPDVIGTGEDLTFSVVVRNSGDGNAASGGTFTLYQSTVPNFISGDMLDPGVTLPAINTGSSSPPQTFTLGAPALGAYYYGVCVTHSDDSSNSNDCSAAVEVLVVNTASAISAGTVHTCAIVAGAARCWGHNGSGRLGDGSTTASNIPVQVSGLGSDVTAVSAGEFHSCAVHNGEAKCWGNNANGRLGDGSTTARNIPVVVVQTPADTSDLLNLITAVPLGSGVTAISAGNDHTCAVHSGEAKCWGHNGSGQLGDGSNTASNVPRTVVQTAADMSDPIPIAAVPLGSGVTAISVGSLHSCALHNGAARCWGHNGNGRLGDGNNTSSRVAAQVAGLDSGVTAISAGRSHSCAVQGGEAKCWGYNTDGRLGDGTNTTSWIAVQVMGLDSGVTAISAGTVYTCAIHNGAAKCWGWNNDGQLGDGTATNRSSPVQVMGLDSGVTAISAGAEEHTCALHQGIVKCWGSNDNGKLGAGDLPDTDSDGTPDAHSLTPVPVLLL